MNKIFAHLNEQAEEAFAKYFNGSLLDWRPIVRREFLKHVPMPEVGQLFEFELPLGLLTLKAGVGLEEKDARLVVVGEVKAEFDVPFAEVFGLKLDKVTELPDNDNVVSLGKTGT